MGVGLAAAKNVSDILGLRLTVEQNDEVDGRFPERYATTFQSTLARADTN